MPEILTENPLTRIPQMDARFFTRRSVIYSIIQ